MKFIFLALALIYLAGMFVFFLLSCMAAGEETPWAEIVFWPFYLIAQMFWIA